MDQIFNHYGKIIAAVLGIIIVIAIIYAVSVGVKSNSASLTDNLQNYVVEQMAGENNMGD
ncbi:MAG: hypothetical protein E7242_06825 [Lachnospiraceae bacterium]|nr:hypothetical protein [Lachnospiraceae bacterium]